MPPTNAATAETEPKRGHLTGAALTDEVFDSSPTLLRNARGRTGAVLGRERRQLGSGDERPRHEAAVDGG